ncbi:Uma2 family endonuclease [cf. Phormidesmis sp. LEGE 11477]|uniref:Uma2 family endonuclease n=1 Tax=cf. Phormidesmis sp. LEGE 11477 TaxID=1828680 RepID=UPI00187F30E9|nr:Uma2 family endonuclease [cf. Phormidesmis sp. LEGE 11477]MBE9060940.1 Uma2 family endonuclease [cf. Phormidesmis sp. LEGE 11477]
MTQAAVKSLSFSEFVEIRPDDGRRYELVNGQISEIMATRAHDDVVDFIYDAFRDQVKKTQSNWKITRFGSIKTFRDDGLQQGRTPDVSVIDREIWNADLRAYAALEDSIQLAVEVTPTNWRDDYLYKLAEYEQLGIDEYWIVDYLALGAARYIGSPKTPTISVYQLAENEYYLQQFRGEDVVISQTFPELRLTAQSIFSAVGG